VKKAMAVSSKRYLRKCAILAVFLLTAFLFSAVAGEDTSRDYFSDNFDGAIDTGKWVVQENTDMTGYPAYGGLVRVADSQIVLSSDGSGFPCVTTAVNPFPVNGDFSLEFDFTYTCISDWGNGFWVSNGSFIYTEEARGSNVIFQLWADNDGYDVVSIRVYLFGDRVYFSEIYGWEPSAPTHVFRLDYINGTYTVFVDTVEVASVSSQVRPDTMGFGHPPAYYIPYSPEHVRSVVGGWSSFKIDYIKVTGTGQSLNKNTARISLSASSEMWQIGYTVDISGALTNQEDEPFFGETIILSYCISGTSNWDPIASATTGSNGFYSVSWIPSATGKFALKAEWLGNETYSGTYEVKNISVSRYASESLFFAESNSTLSSLAFNSTSKEISFTVSGPSGTTGYTRFLISKALMQNFSDFAVYLDGRPVEFTAASEGDFQSLYFEYTHSTHQVTIKLPNSVASELPSWLAIPSFIAVTLFAVFLFRKKRVSKPKTNNLFAF
jgi:hypothetical protein